MRKSVILGAARTPFGRFGGGLLPFSAVELGAAAIKEAIERSGIDSNDVEHVTMGCVLQAGLGQLPSRQASFKAGLGREVTSETLNKVCAGGLRAVTQADIYIRAGENEVIVAGGMESMSNAPYLLPKARWGYRMGNDVLVDEMVQGGLTCPFHNVHMAVFSSDVAAEKGVSREDQDQWALRSHQRAARAQESGLLGEEIVPVSYQDKKKGTITVDKDEGIRPDSSLEGLAKLAPIFTEDGTTTAGNAPGVNDGAGALVVTSAEYAEAKGLNPMASILAHATAAWDPPYLATLPAMAGERALRKLGMTAKDLDLVEINEAFASVAITSTRMLGVDPEKVNVNGGAVALGHPIGASGARILTTLIYELRRRGGGLGMAAICSGTGQGDAVIVEVK